MSEDCLKPTHYSKRTGRSGRTRREDESVRKRRKRLEDIEAAVEVEEDLGRSKEVIGGLGCLDRY